MPIKPRHDRHQTTSPNSQSADEHASAGRPLPSRCVVRSSMTARNGSRTFLRKRPPIRAVGRGGGVSARLLRVVIAKDYGFRTLQATSQGAFALKTYVLDEYQKIVGVTITGRISGQQARGHVVVSEPPGAFTGVAGDRCSGDVAWTASKPTPPAPPGPSAFFQWAAIRVPTGASYRYYFAVNDLNCTNDANEVLITVAGRSTIVPCSRPAAFASGPLAPGQTYQVTSQAQDAINGRVVKRGTPVTAPLAMPEPGDLWTIVSGLPGTPPS